eukprot:scaffold90748_cov63-Phaeocystis_antarctica.AAC.2
MRFWPHDLGRQIFRDERDTRDPERPSQRIAQSDKRKRNSNRYILQDTSYRDAYCHSQTAQPETHSQASSRGRGRIDSRHEPARPVGWSAVVELADEGLLPHLARALRVEVKVARRVEPTAPQQRRCATGVHLHPSGNVVHLVVRDQPQVGGQAVVRDFLGRVPPLSPPHPVVSHLKLHGPLRRGRRVSNSESCDLDPVLISRAVLPG